MKHLTAETYTNEPEYHYVSHTIPYGFFPMDEHYQERDIKKWSLSGETTRLVDLAEDYSSDIEHTINMYIQKVASYTI